MKTLHKIKRLFWMLLPLLCYGWGANAQYCTIDFTAGGEAISLVDFAGISNTTSAASTTTYEDFTGMTGTVVQTQAFPITVKSNTYGAYTNWVRVYVDWNQNQDFSDPGEAYDIGSIYNSTGVDAVQAAGTITVPVGALTGNTRMRVTARYAAYVTGPCNTSGYGQAEDYTINVLATGACTGNPVAGVAAGPTTVCANTAFSLTATGYTAAAGISFEWQADDGGGWQPIPGATDPSYNVSTGIVSPTNYQLVVTCANGGGQDISNTVSVGLNVPAQCYCSISFSSPDPITLVEFGGVSNPTSATGLSVYEDFTALTANVVQGQYYTLNVKGTTGGAYTDSIRAFIDWDQNGVFDVPSEAYDLGPIYNSSGTDAVVATLNIFIPNNAVPGLTRMRVTKAWDYYPAAGPCNTGGYGQAEDYSVNVILSTSCSGAPTAGTASAPASVCPGTAFNLALTGNTVATGVTMQWEYYDSGLGSWQPIAGATASPFNVSNIASPTDYRAVVTCSNGGLTDISNVVSVGVTPFTSCYCTPQNFGNATILNVTIGGTTLNNSSVGGTPPNYYSFYPPVGSATADLMAGFTYSITGSFSGSAIASVWIDYNQNGQYETNEWTQLTTSGNTGVAALQIPAGALSGLTGMRVRTANSGGSNGPLDACITMFSGETEDYLVNIVPAVSCSGAPNPGIAAGPATVCAGAPFVLDLTGFTVANGVDVQWEEDPGTGWQPIAGATNSVYVNAAGITAGTSYRASVGCASGSPASSNTIAVGIAPASQCYCTIGFPSGDVEPITLVDVAGISNSSSDVIAGSPDYEDFTALSGTVAQGQSYPINVKGNTNGPYTDYIRVFVDWDQNGLFTDPGESYDIGTLYNSTGTDATQASGNIAVPAGALVGTTRMRVTKKWNGYATACNTSGYGQAEEYLLNVGFPLAIALKNIEAVNTGADNKLSWTTGAELPGDYFEVQRSADGHGFVPLATINAAGVAGNYSWVDHTPFEGINYYRLKLIAASGASRYSRIVSAEVKTKQPFELAVYPNPSSDFITITANGIHAGAILLITDMAGRTLKSISIRASTSVDIRSLVRGSYLLKYDDGEHSKTVKLIKL